MEGSLMPDYTGQLIGGPDDGNVITANTHRVHFEQQTWHWLEGQFNMPSVNRVTGVYVWDIYRGVFVWHRHA